MDTQLLKDDWHPVSRRINISLIFTPVIRVYESIQCNRWRSHAGVRRPAPPPPIRFRTGRGIRGKKLVTSWEGGDAGGIWDWAENKKAGKKSKHNSRDDNVFFVKIFKVKICGCAPYFGILGTPPSAMHFITNSFAIQLKPEASLEWASPGAVKPW